ncbi:MAG: NTP transferase domain-containing protein [Deltaproteobacteria bacterium]|nr:NTP transferase domain-containing protein [Deltaproteobacteria bacterium]
MANKDYSIEISSWRARIAALESQDMDHPRLRGMPEPGVWAIVLAGGNGERFKELAEKLYGYPRCKQYCAILGGRSMIQHTLARAEYLIPPERTLVVVSEDHREEVLKQLADRHDRTILFQPQNRDTAAGVLLPLTWIARRDPEAVVVILPSDHFVLEEARFMAYVLRAKRLVEMTQSLCVLLGMDAEAPETSYGWIEPADPGEMQGLFRVRAFYEKPAPTMAEYLYRSGCLWNTLVMVTRAATLLQMYKEHLPDLYKNFHRLAPLLGTVERKDALKEAYATMPAISISHGLLQHNPANLRALRVSGVLWSDWGSPNRVRQTLERIGRLYELASRLVERGYQPEAVLGKISGRASGKFFPPAVGNSDSSLRKHGMLRLGHGVVRRS